MHDDELPLGTGEAPATYVSHLESDLLSLIGMLERHANLGKRTVQIGQVRRAAALVTQDSKPSLRGWTSPRWQQSQRASC